MDFSRKVMFNSDSFSHMELFGDNPVWEALTKLYDYLLKQGEMIVGKDTLIEEGAIIEGPCVIGDNCIIRHGARLRGGVLLGHGCVVGHCSEIKHSILLNGAKAPHFNYVGDSVLGFGVNIGAGAKTANVRHDKGLVRISGVNTGLKKLGLIAGDGVQIGCNAVTNPGTVLFPGTQVFPCQSIKGVHGNKTLESPL